MWVTKFKKCWNFNTRACNVSKPIFISFLSCKSWLRWLRQLIFQHFFKFTTHIVSHNVKDKSRWTPSLSLQIGYDDGILGHLKSASEVEKYIGNIWTHVQAYYCHPSLGSKVKVERVGAIKHIEGKFNKLLPPKFQNYRWNITLVIEPSIPGEVCLWKILKSETNIDIKKFNQYHSDI